nr:reverse transcriptase domain-containing protein [Tanacetum cinerariifolium]
MPNVKSSIPYLARRDNERRRDQANEKIEKFYKIFFDMSFEISFTDALIPMSKFSSTLKALIGNKEKLSEMTRTPMNEPCSAVILNKLPRKLGDPGKFLIPCGNFNQGQLHRPQVNQLLAYQASAYQAPIPQTQGQGYSLPYSLNGPRGSKEPLNKSYWRLVTSK